MNLYYILADGKVYWAHGATQAGAVQNIVTALPSGPIQVWPTEIPRSNNNESGAP
jgi:hypothetical protein